MKMKIPRILIPTKSIDITKHQLKIKQKQHYLKDWYTSLAPN